MRIPSIYLLFILALVNAWSAPSTSLVKGSVYSAEATGTIIYLFESETNSTVLDQGKEIRVKELIEFKSTRDNCKLHLFLSNKANVFMLKKGWFTIENFEHIIDKDEKGNPVDSGEILNMYVRGKADFVMDSIKEEGYISVNTHGADLEIKSKNFYVDSSDYNTIVECYDGKISMTDSISLKTTILEAGNYASVFSSGGEKNTIIRIYPLTPEMISSRKERISNSPKVEWKFTSRSVTTKP